MHLQGIPPTHPRSSLRHVQLVKPQGVDFGAQRVDHEAREAEFAAFGGRRAQGAGRVAPWPAGIGNGL